jgi:hypothetical protein
LAIVECIHPSRNSFTVWLPDALVLLQAHAAAVMQEHPSKSPVDMAAAAMQHLAANCWDLNADTAAAAAAVFAAVAAVFAAVAAAVVNLLPTPTVAPAAAAAAALAAGKALFQTRPPLPQLLLPIIALRLPPVQLHLPWSPSTAGCGCSCSVSGNTRFTSNYRKQLHLLMNHNWLAALQDALL